MAGPIVKFVPRDMVGQDVEPHRTMRRGTPCDVSTTNKFNGSHQHTHRSLTQTLAEEKSHFNQKPCDGPMHPGPKKNPRQWGRRPAACGRPQALDNPTFIWPPKDEGNWGKMHWGGESLKGMRATPVWGHRRSELFVIVAQTQGFHNSLATDETQGHGGLWRVGVRKDVGGGGGQQNETYRRCRTATTPPSQLLQDPCAQGDQRTQGPGTLG